MTCQGTVEALTHGGLDASLLAQHLYDRLSSADSLQKSAWVCLEVILSADDAICDLGTFAFVESHLFSMRGKHAVAVADIIRLIEILEEHHTEV